METMKVVTAISKSAENQNLEVLVYNIGFRFHLGVDFEPEPCKRAITVLNGFRAVVRLGHLG